MVPLKRLSAAVAIICAFVALGVCGAEIQRAGGGGGQTPTRALPARIICLSPYPADILCDLGEKERIVAIAGLSKHGSTYHALKDKPYIGGDYGGSANLEMIVGLNPDLVFCSDSQKDMLVARGLKVYITKTYDIDGIIGLITDIGAIVGRQKEAEKIVTDMRSRIRRVEEKVKNVKNRPLVYFEQNIPGKTRGKGSLTHELITRAGGINIAKDEPVSFPMLSQEFIISKNPDAIIVEQWGTKPEDIKQRDGWRNIKAIKNNRIFVSKGYYTGYTQNCLDGLEEYAKFFYPELFDK